MNEPNVTARLERLEGRCRRLGLCATAGAVLAVVAVSTAFRAPREREVLGADEYVLRDDVGRPRAILGVEEGEVGLRLMDPGGNVRARLAVDKLGAPRFDLLDDLGRVRSTLALDAESAAYFRAIPESGEGGAWFGVNENGNPVAHLDIPDELPHRLVLGASTQRTGITIVEKGDVTFRAP